MSADQRSQTSQTAATATEFRLTHALHRHRREVVRHRRAGAELRHTLDAGADETPGIERQMPGHNIGHSIFSVFFIGPGPRLREAVSVKEQAVARAEVERLRRILPATEPSLRKARG